jgi:hypothetical protein
LNSMLTNITPRMHKAWLRRTKSTMPWLIALTFVVVEIRRVAGQVTVRYPDFPAWAERAAQFDLRHLAEWQWVYGLYPLGYPLLLRLGAALGIDVLSTAFALSIAGGFLGLLGTFFLVQRMAENWTLALCTQVILACTAHYLFFASLDSTDMLAAGVEICSLAVLLAAGRRRHMLFWAGLLAGLSYLIRYTASLTIMLCAAYIVGVAWARRRQLRQQQGARRWWLSPFPYLLGAAAGAALQLIPSAIIKGNPFYNTQAHNLWFHVSGGGDYIFDWNAVPMDISLWEVVRAYPRELVTHWLETVRDFWVTDNAVILDVPFAMLMQAGLLFTVLGPTALRRSARAFLGLYVIGNVALLSLIRLDKRFLITLMPLLVFATVYFLWSILPARITTRWRALPLRTPAMILLTVWSVGYPLQFMESNPQDKGTLAVSNTLHAAGMQSADEVYSTHVRYHDVADIWKSRFRQASAIAPRLPSYNALLDLLQQRGYRFLIYDRDTGELLYPDLEFLLRPESRPESLIPLYIEESRKYVVYRVLDDESVSYAEVGASWSNGIILKGYEVYCSDDEPRHENHQRLGLYLYWQATEPVAQMLKVFVHVMDADGQLVAQHDGIPALWTYSTDRWQVGETVVDFHPVLLETPLPAGSYTIQVGLYTERSGRIAVLDPSGELAGDSVTLHTLTVP